MEYATVISIAAAAIAALSIAYTVFAATRVAAFRRSAATSPRARCEPPITVLKPLCGSDPELGENLRSFCDQDYPDYQILFGVRDRFDPAVPAVEAVIAAHPGRDLRLVVDPRVHGTNLKVSNLLNLYRYAKHDILVVADSDVRVTPDYLTAVAAPFAGPDCGAVTCLYRGQPIRGLPSRLLAMYVNEWFFPAMLVATSLGKLRFCTGATMAVRRSVLEELGGFEALAENLADDYLLGRLVAARGYRVVLSGHVVRNVLLEPDLRSALRHELRWARTMRTVRPVGYLLSAVTDTVPVCLLAALLLLLTGAPGVAVAGLLAAGGASRGWLHFVIEAGRGSEAAAPLWLVPIRDCLTFAVRIASFAGRSVHWRGQRLDVRRGGGLEREGSRSARGGARRAPEPTSDLSPGPRLAPPGGAIRQEARPR